MEQVKRVTKMQRMEDIKALLRGESVTYGTDVDAAIEFLSYEQAQLLKKNASGDKKATETQKENAAYKQLIINYLMGEQAGKTVTDIQRAVPELAPPDISNQRVTRMLSDLIDAGTLKKEKVKGKSLFSVA